MIAAPDLQQKTQLLLVDNLATVTLRVSKAVNFFVFLIVICFCFSVAHSLGSEELNYGTEATETVPDCRGNETSLSLCPAQPSPPNCAAHCARVDCNVDIIPTPSWQIASTSITETLSTSPHIRVTSIEATSTMQATFVSATVAVSVTTQPHVAPIETSTSTDKEEISEFRVLNLNKTSVMVIVGIVTVIVAAGVVASSYIIIRGARKRRRQETKKIVMTPNDAYLNREEALQLKNGVAACGLRADPVYEQIE